MKKLKKVCFFLLFLFCISGCKAQDGQLKVIHVRSLNEEEKKWGFMMKGQKQGSGTILSPIFLEKKQISLCSLAQDYITLSESEFSSKYSEEDLWSLGAFDRLLFTDRAVGEIIAGIKIGDSQEKVKGLLGDPQFGKKGIYNAKQDRNLYYNLWGYKTPEYYFAFKMDFDDQLNQVVQSICIRKRYPIPEEEEGILEALSEIEPWYGNNQAQQSEQWKRYFADSDRITITQWGRGSLTMICDYGFVSSSMVADTYGVYADFEGTIPVLPLRLDEISGEFYDPITLYSVDYPEQMIYNIYNYLSQQQEAILQQKGIFSLDGSLFAYAVNDGNLLNLAQSADLYENSHVVLHWMDKSCPDRQLYFGHFSDVVGFPSNRYLIESNRNGLHVYDIQEKNLIYFEEDIFSGDTADFRMDYVNQCILDGENRIRYQYCFDENGLITIVRQLDYEH